MNLGFHKSVIALNSCPNIRPSIKALLHVVHVFLIRVHTMRATCIANPINFGLCKCCDIPLLNHKQHI